VSKNLTPDKVVEIFLSKTYRVFMLGFLPGFSYMGEVDERIVTPRRQTPRTKVPKGSVGIAGRQTGIYSLESPGGWQIIGRTIVELFTPEAETPTFLQAGDSVKFYETQF
jgi:KipI family sensor histidine kinase inhibitor